METETVFLTVYDVMGTTYCSDKSQCVKPEIVDVIVREIPTHDNGAYYVAYEGRQYTVYLSSGINRSHWFIALDRPCRELVTA